VARFTFEAEGQTTGSRWEFQDSDENARFTNRLVALYSWRVPDVYDVHLTVFNDSFPNGVSVQVTVDVVETPIYYVNPANSAPAFPYQSWETASTNIQEAIGAGTVPGRVVLVTNGVYDTGSTIVFGQMMNRIALTNGVVVRSVNGPKFTILRGSGGLLGDGAVRCAYVGHSSVLDGFTLTNGVTRAAGHESREQGGGGAWCESRGVATNCIFAGNRANRDGGGANGGIFFRCSFIGNRAENGSGAVDDAELYHSVIESNSAPSAGGAGESILTRCNLVNNIADFAGGGAQDSTLMACTLFANQVGSGFGGAAIESELVNCLVSRNHSRYSSGALYASKVDHCTVVGNTADQEVGGVYASLVRNSILYDNYVGTFVTNYAFSTFRHSLTTPIPPGDGNISGPPIFLNALDYRLRPGSPGIDAAPSIIWSQATWTATLAPSTETKTALLSLIWALTSSIGYSSLPLRESARTRGSAGGRTCRACAWKCRLQCQRDCGRE
jgi:hypothetical protein